MKAAAAAIPALSELLRLSGSPGADAQMQYRHRLRHTTAYFATVALRRIGSREAYESLTESLMVSRWQESTVLGGVGPVQ